MSVVIPSENFLSYNQALVDVLEENAEYFRDIVSKFVNRSLKQQPVEIFLAAMLELFGEAFLENAEPLSWEKVGVIAYLGWLSERGDLDV